MELLQAYKIIHDHDDNARLALSTIASQSHDPDNPYVTTCARARAVQTAFPIRARAPHALELFIRPSAHQPPSVPLR
jgi:hypothetical protein